MAHLNRGPLSLSVGVPDGAAVFKMRSDQRFIGSCLEVKTDLREDRLKLLIQVVGFPNGMREEFAHNGTLESFNIDSFRSVSVNEGPEELFS